MMKCGRRRGRITPAYAGKTFFVNFGTRCVEDHPRVCGENKEAQAIKVLRTGSPPRMRGKHLHGESLQAMLRITPAYAGKT